MLCKPLLSILSIALLTTFPLTKAEVPNFRHVISNFSIPEEFYFLDFPNPPNESGNFITHGSCLYNARLIEEPYTSHYWPRRKLELGEPWNRVKRSFWQWTEPITKELFDQTRSRVIVCNCQPGCTGCDQPVHFKILGGRLYITSTLCDPCPYRRPALEEILKVVLYLYDIPDMEFLVYMGDGVMRGSPVISEYIMRGTGNEGFTMPTYGVWMNSLGPVQMASYHACLGERYPPRSRIPLAVWRGSSTNGFKVNLSNYLQAPRIWLALLSRNHSDLLDARLTKLHSSTISPEVQALAGETSRILHLEDMNRYCAILHLDGNGWSDRFLHALVHFPTPILKLATNRTAHLEHVYAPGDAVRLYGIADAEDLLGQVREVVRECQAASAAGAAAEVQHPGAWAGGLSPLAARMQRLSRAYLDHMGVAEAMAYSLLSYKNWTAFPVDPSLEGFREVEPGCCALSKVPPAFAAAVSARLASGAAGGDGGGSGGRR